MKEVKEKIIIFVVGLLLGSIISTGAIYVYTIANNKTQDMPNMQENFKPNEMNGTMPNEIPNK